jgi:hypothetical protein
MEGPPWHESAVFFLPLTQNLGFSAAHPDVELLLHCECRGNASDQWLDSCPVYVRMNEYLHTHVHIACTYTYMPRIVFVLHAYASCSKPACMSTRSRAQNHPLGGKNMYDLSPHAWTGITTMHGGRIYACICVPVCESQSHSDG